MALRYEWCWDIDLIGNVAAKVTDDGGSFEVQITTGAFGHTDISGVDSDFTDFASELETALNDGTSSADTYTVTWNGTTGYEIAYGGEGFALAFSTVTTAAEGTRMAQILGFSGDASSATSQTSDVRPYYVIIPAIQGRSMMSDEYEPDSIMYESTADDGSVRQVSRETSEIWSDWTQTAETTAAPSSFSAAGTYVFERQATSAIPWTYQHAWEHQRTGDTPLLVLDGTEQAVHQIRAEGASFKPTRFAGQDLPYWQIPFRTRLLGRL